MDKPVITVSNAGFQVDHKWLLKGVSFDVYPGTFSIIMGMNGAGKSTLLKLLSGVTRATEGTVMLEEQLLHTIPSGELALKRAVLTQQHELSFHITAEEVVMMGRYPYMKSQATALDVDMVKRSMERMDIIHLAKRYYHTLSGGEAQKVQMSRVLCQIGTTSADNRKLLLLDEPVSHLDVKYQYQFLEVAKQLTSEYVTVVAVLHDINLAVRYADHILFLKEGKLVHRLNEPAAISTEIISDVFGIQTKIIPHPDIHYPVVLFSSIH